MLSESQVQQLIVATERTRATSVTTRDHIRIKKLVACTDRWTLVEGFPRTRAYAHRVGGSRLTTLSSV